MSKTLKAKARGTSGFTNLPDVMEKGEVRAVSAVKYETVIKAFCARVAEGMSGLLEEADTDQLLNVLAAPSDCEVMLRVLQMPEAMNIARGNDPLAAARIRGIETRKQLLESEGGTFAVGEVAEILGLSRQAVDKRRKANQLIGLDLGRHGYAYPVWQFGKAGTLKGLEEVLEDLRNHDPWMQAQFLLQPNSRLGNRAPLHLLREGNIGAVCHAARALGEHGAA